MKVQAINKLKSKGVRLFLFNKLKKYSASSVAESVQRTLHLFVTKSFDIRTMTILSKPMKKKHYEHFKEGVNAWLNKIN